MKTKKYLFVGFLILLLPITVQAGILDSLGCVATGNCGLADVETGFQLLTNWLLGGVGALGLLYFIWGAGKWITSSGQSDKISLGKDIMIGSITAIIIALISFILIQFFINDVLLGGDINSEYRVSAECSQASQGKRCNEPLINFACSGTFEEQDKKQFNNLCITSCELQNLTSGHNWVCVNKEIVENLENPTTADLCPTNEQVCLDVDSVPAGTLNFGGNGSASAGENYPGCCQVGFQNCHPDNESNCQRQLGQFFSRSCAEVNFCNSGYVQQSHGCCVTRTSPVSCQDVSQGDVCDESANALIPYQACSELDYCN